MRVTENTTFGVVRDSIHRSRGRMENLQSQTATLKKINTPSDNPIGSIKVLQVRTDKVNNDQYQLNARMAESFLNNTDHGLSELSEIVMRAKEIAINQSSGPSSNPDTRIGVAEEVTQLYKQAVAVANRKIGDRYLFGGFQTTTPPVDAEGAYKGDDGHMMVEVAKGVFISFNVPGSEAFSSAPLVSKEEEKYNNETGATRKLASERAEREGPPIENVNVFDELQNLRIGLLTGHLDGIRSTLERLDQLQGRLTAIRAQVGSRTAGLATTTQSIERQNITNAELSSSLEDADMAQVVSDLAKEETVFRSALNSSRRLIQPTLLEFLR